MDTDQVIVPELLDLDLNLDLCLDDPATGSSDRGGGPKRTDPNKVTRRERNEQYKLKKRREEAYATFMRMEKLTSTDSVFSRLPRKSMCIVNIGCAAMGGATSEQLEAVFGKYAGFERIVMKLGKPYSFVIFRSCDDARAAYADIHGNICAELNSNPVFLEYLTHLNFAYLADRSLDPSAKPETLDSHNGLHYMANFITEDEEQRIMQCIGDDEQREIAAGVGNADKWYRVQERFVKHYGHSFDYHRKHIGDASMTASQSLPSWIHPFIGRIHQQLPHLFADQYPDQLTIQRYPPGAGIAFHADSHTSFTDTLVILSMGTPVQMDFRKPASHALVTLDLEPGSLVLMTGEARYGWEHAIRIRRSDVIDGKLRERNERWSITMRIVNKDLTCSCQYSALCDSDARHVQRIREEQQNQQQ
ncbi:hypothetical protein GGF37_000160 [Kickxella alabastrina]|nr:hypothetical protein GGF37_000160 [Kickxella alabastrina]